jgi:hypothetical protein
MTPVGCPAVAPSPRAESCPSNIPADGCRYEFECNGGPEAFTFRCASSGVGEDVVHRWTLEARDCERPFDQCNVGEARVQCFRDGQWTQLGVGNDGPLGCPDVPAEIGAKCYFDFTTGPAICGYPCVDGSGWTVAACRNGQPAIWLSDGACPGDCSGVALDLRDYLEANDQCETDADCHVARAPCSRFAGHCSGAYVLGPSGDDAVLEKLLAEVRSCSEAAGTPWTCDMCNEVAPPPRCYAGSCVF